MVKFDMTIENRPDKLNATVDGLRRKAQLDTLEESELPTTTDGSQIRVLKELQNRIEEGLRVDLTTTNIMKQVKEGKMKKFFLRDGLLYFGECL